MAQAKAILTYNNRVYIKKSQALFRVFIAFCLIGILFLGISLPTREKVLLPEQPLETEATANGLGGGYLENSIDEEHFGETVYLETVVLEPDFFSGPRMLLYTTYTVQRGDIIGALAENYGLNQDTLLSINNITNSRLIQIGQVLRIPNQDGIMYTVRQGDTLESIAEKHQSDASAIQHANELFSAAALPGSALFIPGARLEWSVRQEINGDLFIWPAAGRITSPYGYRRSPFTNIRQFHNGLDIGAPMGAPVRAAMSGRVSTVGWDDILGNYIIISHSSGYRTLYAHLSQTRVRAGAYVGTGERIGDVGSTGLSTGPHVHFTVFRNNSAVNPRSLMR